MNKLLLSFLIITVVGVFLTPASQELVGKPRVVRAVEGEVTGWAWIGADCTDFGSGSCGNTTRPVGWVSFNSSNEGASVDYGVWADYDASPENTLQGEAWIGAGDSNENVGWLLFDDNSVPAWADSNNYARIENEELKGWAPIRTKDKNGNPTTLTWVSFKGSNYSNVIAEDGTVGDSDTSHYAWSGRPNDMRGGLGWIDMNPYRGNPDVSEDDTVRFPEPQAKPDQPELYTSEHPNGETWNHCSVQGLSIPTFNWTYSHPEDVNQAGYHIQVDQGGSVLSPFLMNKEVNQPSIAKTPSTKWVRDNLNWGQLYAWKVRVKDVKEVWSVWSVTDNFSMPTHAYPWPDFSCDNEDCSKVVLTEGKTVTLTDTSDYYTARDHCEWTLPDDSTVISGNPNVDCVLEVKFTNTGEQEVGLEAYDVDGHSCATSKDLNITIPLPKWKEI